MRKLEYQVSFNTPAFLGNAEQLAQWRTPPFKALIRHWWRIVKAPVVEYRTDILRREEGRLFGVAADGGESSRSAVRLRLSDWNPGTQKVWDADDRIVHPEVTNAAGQAMRIGAQLYLGYGPLGFRAGNTVLNGDPPRTAIAVDEHKTLIVITPNDLAPEIEHAVSMAAWFGSLGSRSRNGWGSLQVVSQAQTPAIPDLSRSAVVPFQRELSRCLELDWSHAIGADGGHPLVWRTKGHATWTGLMRDLASIKIAFRTQPDLMSFAGVPPGQFAPRHLLAYPVTHHGVRGTHWGQQGRLANQLRFKAFKAGQQWVGTIVHTPCRLPAEMLADLSPAVRQNFDVAALASWRQVHKALDEHAQRISDDD